MIDFLNWRVFQKKKNHVFHRVIFNVRSDEKLNYIFLAELIIIIMNDTYSRPP